MATTERDVLEAKVLPELQAIASSMGVQGYFRLRKADLIGAIIAKARGEEFTPSSSTTRSRRAASTAKSAAAKDPATAESGQPSQPGEPVGSASAAGSAVPEASAPPAAAAPEATSPPAPAGGDGGDSSGRNGRGNDRPAATTDPQPTSTAGDSTESTTTDATGRSAGTPATEPAPQAGGQDRADRPADAAPAGPDIRQGSQQGSEQGGQAQAGQPQPSAGEQATSGQEQPAAAGESGSAAPAEDRSGPGETPSGGDATSGQAGGERGEATSESETTSTPRRRRRRTRGGSGGGDDAGEPLQGILSAVTSGVTPVNRQQTQTENGEAPAASTETATDTSTTPGDVLGDGQSGQRDQGDRGQRRDWGQGGRWDGGGSQQSSSGGGRRSRSRNRRNRNRFGGGDVAVADRADFRDRAGVPDDRPEVARKGILDIRSQDGYGFLRVNGYLPGPDDVYVPLSMIRRLGLRRGDEVEAHVKLPRDNSEKYAACSRVDKVNGLDPEEARNRKDFKDLTPLYPDERLKLEHNPTEISTRVMDLMCPVGKGQRGLIVSPPKAGKTTLMKQVANAVSENNPEVHLILLLVGERPEEVTDMQRSTRAEVIFSTFDRASEDHCQISELTIERAKRLVEYGKDVMILLDGITRLSRAYNLATPASGKILSGGVDSAALYPPKRFFGAARNLEEGGSLTILATALVDTGSRMDEVIFEEFKGTGNMEVRLDRKLSERRIFPALDIDASSTRREELLLSQEELVAAWKLRRVLGALEPAQALEMVVDQMRRTKTNSQFLQVIQRANMGN